MWMLFCFYDATTWAINIKQIWSLHISTPLWSHTYIGDLFRGLLWRCREVTWCHMFPHSHARWTRQTRRYSLWHHRALWSLLASHTVLRVVEAKEELEIKSDHALQWLDDTMISLGLRGEGLWALWVHMSAYSNLNSAQSLSHLDLDSPLQGSDLVPLDPYTTCLQPDDKARDKQTVQWKRSL